jgi:hypothetical protein
LCSLNLIYSGLLFGSGARESARRERTRKRFAQEDPETPPGVGHQFIHRFQRARTPRGASRSIIRCCHASKLSKPSSTENTPTQLRRGRTPRLIGSLLSQSRYLRSTAHLLQQALDNGHRQPSSLIADELAGADHLSQLQPLSGGELQRGSHHLKRCLRLARDRGEVSHQIRREKPAHHPWLPAGLCAGSGRPEHDVGRPQHGNVGEVEDADLSRTADGFATAVFIEHRLGTAKKHQRHR